MHKKTPLRNSALAQKEKPKHSFYERMKERARLLPMDRGLFNLVRDLQNPSFRTPSASILSRIENKEGAVPFLYLCAIDSRDDGFKLIVIDILRKIGTSRAREAADDILVRKQKF
jgi:hypothetical protein